MKIAIIVTLAALTTGVGLRAAHLWFQASKVPIVPYWANDPNAIEPVDKYLSQLSWTTAIMQAYQQGAELNARAAAWTAAATFLGMLTTLAGLVPC
ncbi:hypothetical protein ACYT84_07140 [Ralstonia solanacearum]|uniref:hypothetical protein n=1 Tax=Ralstonia solanacearum TaxID=305 RepID=UPI0018CFFD15|nr:hypothetical protein [Ralstonia solanacearum]